MIGTGYVGLVSGACFSKFGTNVVCVDKDITKIEALQNNRMPIYEPYLDDLVFDNIKEKRLFFTTDLKIAMKDADIVFIAVGTPNLHSENYADLNYVYDAAREIAQFLTTRYTIVAIKSTVPVGTSRKIKNIIREFRPDADFDVVSNPEFLREGSAINDFMHPDRIIIGVETDRSMEIMKRLYSVLYLIDTPIVFTSLETSELIKYATNTFLATKVTFINEIADLCEAVGADVHDVARGIGLDGRIGKKFLHPGPGYGGSCFPKDTLALVKIARDRGAPLRIIETVISINDERKQRMVNKIITACSGSVSGKTIAVLGLTFKPNTDDIRDSPSLEIVPALQKAGALIRVFDPKGMEKARHMFVDVTFCENVYKTLQSADAMVVLTEWDEFRALDFTLIKSLLKNPILVDLRNIYDPSNMVASGFHYTSIGRSSVQRNDVNQ
jgi:UDPglucose 6-dehydrogenase